jgi:hypothetical protein
MDSHTGAHGYDPETLTSMVTFCVGSIVQSQSRRDFNESNWVIPGPVHKLGSEQ